MSRKTKKKKESRMERVKAIITKHESPVSFSQYVHQNEFVKSRSHTQLIKLYPDLSCLRDYAKLNFKYIFQGIFVHRIQKSQKFFREINSFFDYNLV